MILHIDMDAFYASVEMLDNPDLKGRPLIVGGVSGRGVVAAASYEARRFGVHSAMPMFQALKKCPDALVVSPRRGRYKEVSRQVMRIILGFSPLVEQVSIDEAYVDVRGCRKLYGNAETIGGKIKKKIKLETGLTCSVGIAPIKFLAKIASDIDKPDGLTLISAEMLPKFIESLPVRKVPGVGPSTASVLVSLGIETLGDVAGFSDPFMMDKLGKFGKRLKELSMGIDRSKVSPFSEVKSVSAEETLPFDTADIRILEKYLLNQAEDVGRQLRKAGMKAKTVSIKTKTFDFYLNTKSRTLNRCTNSSRILFKEACLLLETLETPKKLRLIGLSASGLISEKRPVQLKLFDQSEVAENNWEKVDQALDAIAKRFGRDMVSRAALKEP